MQIIGQRIRELREKRGLTQKQVADAAGISVNTYARWEQSKAKRGFNVIIKIAKFFEVRVDNLLGLEIEEH